MHNQTPTPKLSRADFIGMYIHAPRDKRATSVTDRIFPFLPESYRLARSFDRVMDAHLKRISLSAEAVKILDGETVTDQEIVAMIEATKEPLT